MSSPSHSVFLCLGSYKNQPKELQASLRAVSQERHRCLHTVEEQGAEWRPGSCPADGAETEEGSYW